MTNFHEIRFPADISYKAESKKTFLTNIAELVGGFEQRNISQTTPRTSYVIKFNSITSGQAEKIRDFFIARKGRAYGFRFKDWQDFQAKNQNIGVGDGVTKDFQIIKTYADEIENYDRTITKPVENSVSIYLDDALQTSGFTINYTNGIISFSTAPANGKTISISFDFDVPVRFAKDEFEFSLESFSKGSLSEIELVEVRI